MQYESVPNTHFQILFLSKYPELAEEELATLISFCTSYRYEQGFSQFKNIKGLKRERLKNIENNLRIVNSESDIFLKEFIYDEK